VAPTLASLCDGAPVAPMAIINHKGIDYAIGDGRPGPCAKMLRSILVETQLQERQDLELSGNSLLVRRTPTRFETPGECVPRLPGRGAL
jgi:hypothetical protein